MEDMKNCYCLVTRKVISALSVFMLESKIKTFQRVSSFLAPPTSSPSSVAFAFPCNTVILEGKKGGFKTSLKENINMAFINKMLENRKFFFLNCQKAWDLDD